MIGAFILAFVTLIANRDHPDEHHEIDIRQKALENPDLYGGDMILPSHMVLHNVIANETYRWPGYPGGARVPYVIDAALSQYENLIKSAMEHYHNNTCVRFVERTTEPTYVNIIYGQGCYSVLGMNETESQPQPLSLGKGCLNIGTIIHELGHCIGFFHEHNRSDRDNYLDINWNNIIPRRKNQFDVVKPGDDILYNVFDYDSIMIYGNYAFSMDPKNLKTMEAKNGQELKNPYEKTEMTASDIERVNKMYQC